MLEDGGRKLVAPIVPIVVCPVGGGGRSGARGVKLVADVCGRSWVNVAAVVCDGRLGSGDIGDSSLLRPSVDCIPGCG